VGAAAVIGYLAWSFIGTESGLLRIQALRKENRELERKKVELAARAEAAEQARKAVAKDPLLPERVARERFHLVKEGETVYFYRDDAPAAEVEEAPTPSDP
jgi:cell division protein FtsB